MNFAGQLNQLRECLFPVPYSRLDAKREWGKPPRPRCIAAPCSEIRCSQIRCSLFPLLYAEF
ncbi:hypothetical protein [Moorena producens]|uniref:hypothetical protein n=1 Tax=Moorena producens TaxID=1155739 RepID=UPI0011EA6A04|nr:hypothetical protein [Moorena producens]